jgi:hypothetical protein
LKKVEKSSHHKKGFFFFAVECKGAQARKQGLKKNSSSVNGCSFFFLRLDAWTEREGKKQAGVLGYDFRSKSKTCACLCDGA